MVSKFLPVDQLRSLRYVFLPWVIAPPLSNFDNLRRPETAMQFLASAYFVYITKCNIDPQTAMKCKAYISSKTFSCQIHVLLCMKL